MRHTPNTHKSPCEVLLNSSPFGIATINTNSFLIEDCNPKFATMIGEEPKGVRGNNLLNISPRYQEGKFTSIQMFMKQLSRLKSQEEVKFYWWLEDKNKHRIITEVRCFAIPDTNTVAVFVHDATESWLTTIAMEDIIREVHTTDAQSALNNMVGTLSKTFHLEFVYIAQANKKNTEASTFALIAESELTENVSYDLSISPCLEIYEQKKIIVYDGDLKASYAHNPFVMKDWDVDSYVGVPLWDVSGHFIGHFAACKRGKLEHNELLINFLKKYSPWAAIQLERINKEQELEKLNREKDRLLSILSHDLRGPVGGLETMLEMLMDDELSRADFQDMAADAKRNITGLRNNMETLLEWTYRQREKAKMILSNFSIADETQTVLDFLGGMATEKKINLTHSISTSLEVYADRQQINLVIRNLVSNALKFTPSSGKIHVTATADKDKTRIAVQDTGIGIETTRLPTIFSDHHTDYGTNGEKGTGLGLLLCQEIIEQHGEKIWVESEIGQGSTFYFSLPSVVSTQVDKRQ